MKKRKLFQSMKLSAAALLACSMIQVPAVAEAAPEAVFTADFENGTAQGWGSFGTVKLTVVDTDNTTQGGSHCLAVTGRDATWAGPGYELAGKLEPGATYKLTGKVKYTSELGDDKETFNVNIVYKNGGNDVTSTFATGTSSKGEWGDISGEVVIPETADVSAARIYIDTQYMANPTPADMLDYYLDDLSLVKTKDAAADTDEKTALAKEIGNSNPLMDYKFGADPFAMVYDGRVYVYMTNDSQEFEVTNGATDNSYGNINTINVISSADMVNWTDHGSIPVAGKKNPEGAAKWANNSWAPAAAHKVIDGKDKFFLYFADNGSGVGVLVGDSPVGPFTDPLGKALVSWGTQASEGVTWLFDPAVFVDDDGTGYLYYGGGVPDGQADNPKTVRVVKLGDDMISLDGDAKVIDAPAVFEDSGIHKFGDKYYYSYCSNFSSHSPGYPGQGNICYMVSDNPMGPFTYVGEILPNPATFFGVGGNNHHAIFEFNEEYYITYHAQTVGKAMGVTKGYRSTHINKVDMNEDGTIQPITGDMKGIPQLETLDPYQRIEAETIAWKSGGKTPARWINGLKTGVCAEPGSVVETLNRELVNVTDGDWTSLAGVDFGELGAKSLTAYAASQEGAAVEVRLDSLDSEVIATIEAEATGGNDQFKKFTAELNGITGKHDVYFTFKGEGKDILRVDYWEFAEEEKPEPQKSVVDIFKDIDEGDWFIPYVQNIYDAKIMTGITPDTFAPNGELSRAQLAVILYRLEGKPKVEFQELYPDVADGQFYSEAVVWATENDIINGYQDVGLFRPGRKISREEFAAMMYRYAKFKGYDVTFSKDKIQAFPDVDMVTEFAEDALAWTVDHDIIKGDNGNLSPQGDASRAQSATIMDRFIQTYMTD